jgi:hypothetical protein
MFPGGSLQISHHFENRLDRSTSWSFETVCLCAMARSRKKYSAQTMTFSNFGSLQIKTNGLGMRA